MHQFGAGAELCSAAGGLILARTASFFRGFVQSGKTSMPKAAIAIACCLCLLTLSGCGNTAYGLKKDGQEASHAMDNATHRVLSAGAKK